MHSGGESTGQSMNYFHDPITRKAWCMSICERTYIQGNITQVDTRTDVQFKNQVLAYFQFFSLPAVDRHPQQLWSPPQLTFASKNPWSISNSLPPPFRSLFSSPVPCGGQAAWKMPLTGGNPVVVAEHAAVKAFVTSSARVTSHRRTTTWECRQV